MLIGWRYRAASALGVLSIAVSAVFVANLPFSQYLLTTYVPLINRLDPIVLTGEGLLQALFISALIVLASFTRLYRPEPRRVLDVVLAVQKRVIFAVCAIATLGFFKWSHQLPRQTVIMMTIVLGMALPLFFIAITQSPATRAERPIVVGDDPAGLQRVVDAYDDPILGYVAPPTPYRVPGENAEQSAGQRIADGGQVDFAYGYLGGLSRLDDAIREHNVDSVILAFELADRSEFFGTLHTCHDHGIGVKTHVDHTDSLLVNKASGDGPIVDIDIEPWDIQDRLFKRLFDIAFAGTALFVLSPIILLIAAAIRVEGQGPILFSQNRTYRFGDTFTVYKFRTLKPEPDEEVATEFDDDRRTPLGDFLRMTHLDEIPQLWSILAGDMSVVGPRPAQTDLETEFETEAATWKRRWFVKPGLTGLAQINDATSQNPTEKIDYDVEYIRRQSFSFDVKIVVRQLWHVVQDVYSLTRDK